jgi:hypothetical protein
MIEQLSGLMLDERARIYTKAKTYRHEIIDGMSYIVPASDMVEEFALDTSEQRHEYLADFLGLLKGISKSRYGFVSRDIVLAEIETGNANFYDEADTKSYYDSLERCANHLAVFCGRWGPLGILASRTHFAAMPSDGAYSAESEYDTILFDPNHSHSPAYSQRLPVDQIPVGIQPYADVAKHFFPKMKTGGFPRYGGGAEQRRLFYLNYCEPVTTILNDIRFCEMLFHFETWSLGTPNDESDYASLRASSVGLEAVRVGNTWELNAYGGPLIQYTQILYMLNLLRKDRYVAVCKHATCQKPFMADNPRTEYCCHEHAINARKMRYRKKKERLNVGEERES